MTEALGLAASVAGIVAIAGQVGSGCLFVKGFLEDAKDAPKDIRALRTEMDILGDAAGKVSMFLSNSSHSSGTIDGCEAALKQCVDAVGALGAKIEKDVKRFGGGRAKWWDRMKSAARKKSVAEELVRVERAKTQLMMAMQDQSITSQRDQYQTIEAGVIKVNTHGETMLSWTRGADEATASIKSQGNELITLTKRVDEKLADISNLGPAMKDLTARADETTTSILLHMKDVKDGIARLHQNTLQEAMMEQIMSKVLKQHTDNFQRQISDSPQKSESDAKSDTSENSVVRRQSNSQNTPKCESHTITRRGKTLYRTSFQNRLFALDITTSEYQYKNSNDTSGWNEATTRSKQTTQYRLRFQNFGVEYWSGNPATFYDPSIGRSFRTYNIVPRDAPIMKACERFDYREVRRLFDAGLASPLDMDEYGNSLSSIVTLGLLTTCQNMEPRDKQADAFDMIRLLIECLGGDLGKHNHLWRMLCRYNSMNTFRTPEIVEATRLITMHTSQDPFENGFVARVMNLEFKQTPVCDFILGQQKWCIDLDPKNVYPEQFEGCYVENDLMMMKDIAAQEVEAALRHGHHYIPFADNSFQWYIYDKSIYSPIHLVLAFASQACELERETIMECCANRLVILLERDYNPRQLCPYMWRDEAFCENTSTPTEFARNLNLLELWKGSLKRAGWNSHEIQDFFDETTYVGLPELFNGVNYTTVAEQRRNFMESLRRGAFVDMDSSDLLLLWQTELSADFRTSWWAIRSVDTEVTRALRQMSTPGSWSGSEEVKLMPGVDFSVRYFRHWRCIKDIWENELGYIPPEYEWWYE